MTKFRVHFTDRFGNRDARTFETETPAEAHKLLAAKSPGALVSKIKKDRTSEDRLDTAS